jgi:hypothetical protein
MRHWPEMAMDARRNHVAEKPGNSILPKFKKVTKKHEKSLDNLNKIAVG